MGSAIALRERKPLVPDTPTDQTELITELRQLTNQLKVEEVLSGWGYALRRTEVLGEKEKNAKAYLLVLNPNEHTINVTGFSDLEKASEEYLKVEKSLSTDLSGAQAVLVSVESLTALRSAYPNYYLDTTEFVFALKRAIKPPRSKARKTAKIARISR